MNKVRKPRLNSEVYVIIICDKRPWSVSKQSVFMRNDQGFITPEALDPVKIDECRCVYNYSDYGETWFKSLKELKDFLLNKYGMSLIKESDGYWDVVSKCYSERKRKP